ncbi:MAG TPA: hypothetical protein VF935_06930, partial [Candidatus Acidoferrum sp.]
LALSAVREGRGCPKDLNDNPCTKPSRGNAPRLLRIQLPTLHTRPVHPKQHRRQSNLARPATPVL